MADTTASKWPWIAALGAATVAAWYLFESSQDTYVTSLQSPAKTKKQAGWYVLALGRARSGRTAIKYVVGPFHNELSAQGATASVLQKGYQTRVRYYAKKPS